MTQSDWSIRSNRGAQASVPVIQSADGLYRDVGFGAPMPSVLLDGSGNVIGSSTVGSNTSLNVNIEDVDTELVNVFMHQLTGTTFTLSGAIAVGDTVINLTSVSGLSVGDHLVITENSQLQYTLPQVTAINTLAVTLDGPMDLAYTTSATIELTIENMATAAGSLASPVSFVAKPHASEIWHITRMNFTMTHKSAATDDAFGSLTALTNGVVLRSNTGLLGFRTYANWKDNHDFKKDMNDVDYSDKAGPSLFGTWGRWSWMQRTGTVIRLDGATNDEIEVLVQDDLTADTAELSRFEIKMQGHVEVIG